MFYWSTGPLADDGVLADVHLPTSAAFFPSFSFLGVQARILYCIILILALNQQLLILISIGWPLDKINNFSK